MTPAERAVIAAARELVELSRSDALERLQRALNTLDADQAREIDVQDFIEKAVTIDPRAGFLARRLLDPSSGNVYPHYVTVRALAAAEFSDLNARRNVGKNTLASIALALERVGLFPAWTLQMPPSYHDVYIQRRNAQ